ncbi:MAG: 3-deoxy-D-manno-octulosonic acid transferase [Thermodesulfobacteriota bacterium]
MHSPIFPTALKFYQWGWNLAIPLLYCHSRLKKGFVERTLRERPPQADLWIQAASVGESYLSLELLTCLNPPEKLRVLITTNTSQGRGIIEKVRQNKEIELKPNLILKTAYFPFDSPSIMDKALSAIRPELVLLLESELWPGLLSICRRKGVKVLVVNGRMTRKSLKRYLIWPSFWENNRPDKILAMSEDDARRFGELFGNEVVDTMSNIKFDRISAAGPLTGNVNPLAGLLPPESLFAVLGSVRQEEEKDIEQLIPELLANKPEAIIGLFPRHMHRIKSWQKRLNKMSLDWSLRSLINKPVNSGKVILWDTMGELSPAYSLARAAFVGGSLAPVGGQNFLEPLICGIKPVIGPHWSNFHWIGRQIIDQGLVHEARNRRECSVFLLKGLGQPLDREKNRKQALAYIESRKGGTAKAVDEINSLLNSTNPESGVY